MMTLSLQDVKKLLIKQDRCMPQLMHEMIMRETEESRSHSIARIMRRRRRRAKAYFQDFPDSNPLGHNVHTCPSCQQVQELEDDEDVDHNLETFRDIHSHAGEPTEETPKLHLHVQSIRMLIRSCCHSFY